MTKYWQNEIIIDRCKHSIDNSEIEAKISKIILDYFSEKEEIDYEYFSNIFEKDIAEYICSLNLCDPITFPFRSVKIKEEYSDEKNFYICIMDLLNFAEINGSFTFAHGYPESSIDEIKYYYNKLDNKNNNYDTLLKMHRIDF